MIARCTPCASTSTRGPALVGLQPGWHDRVTTFNSRGMTRRAGAPTFYTTGMEHSPTSATGSAWERTPWRAVQGAARDALKKCESRT